MTDTEYKKLLLQCRKNKKLDLPYYTMIDLLNIVVQYFYAPTVLAKIVCEYAYSCSYLLQTLYKLKRNNYIRKMCIYNKYLIRLIDDLIQIEDILTKSVVHEYKVKYITDYLEAIVCENSRYSIGEISKMFSFIIEDDSSVFLCKSYKKILNIIVSKENKITFHDLNIDILDKYSNPNLQLKDNYFIDYGFVSLELSRAYYEKTEIDHISIRNDYDGYVATISTPYVENFNDYVIDFSSDYPVFSGYIPDLKVKIDYDNERNKYNTITTISLRMNIYEHFATLCRIKQNKCVIIFIGYDFLRLISFLIPSMKQFRIISEYDIITSMAEQLNRNVKKIKKMLTYIRWYCDNQYFYVICSLKGSLCIISKKTYILVKVDLFDKKSKIILYSIKMYHNGLYLPPGIIDEFRINNDKVYFKTTIEDSFEMYVCYAKCIN